MNAWKAIQGALTATGAWLGYFVGGMDGMLLVLTAMMVIDYVTGVMIAIDKKQLSSDIGYKGICRKILILALVGIANLLDLHIIQTGNMLRTATIFFYISNEGISILENAALLGLPVPRKIVDVLAQLKQKSEEDKQKEE